MLNSENELVSYRREPAIADCSAKIHSANLSEHRKLTNTLEQDEFKETFLWRYFQKYDLS